LESEALDTLQRDSFWGHDSDYGAYAGYAELAEGISKSNDFLHATKVDDLHLPRQQQAELFVDHLESMNHKQQQ